MTSMGDHEARNAQKPRLDAGTVRGLVAAWVIVISMAGVSMGFQVYHALKWGHEPWGAAYPEGIVLLLCSVCLLEVISHWDGASWPVRAGGYVILAGSMYLSASATGAVVRPVAPAHQSLLFGFLLDAAALYAFHYILNEPRKARERITRATEERESAARAEASQVATLARALEEERRAREDAERGARETAEAAQSARADAQREATARAQAEAALDEARATSTSTAEALRAAQSAREAAEQRAMSAQAEATRAATVTRAADEALAGLRAGLETANRSAAEAIAAREDADKRAADAEARAAREARKAASPAQPRARDRAPARAQKDQPGSEADVDARTKALKILEAEPGISSAQLGKRCGMSPRWAQEHRAELEDMLAAFSGAGEDSAE